MNSGELKSNNAGFFQSPKLVSLVLLVVFIVGLSAGAVLSGSDLISNSGESEFSITVDNEMGTNKFILIEVDEGDNDEEVVTEHILHEFAFEASHRGGLITWDFSDGFTATGNEATHSFEKPGIYVIEATESLGGRVSTATITITVHLESEAEVDNMECVCAPTAKDTIIPLSEHQGISSIEGFVQVEHDGSSESCSLRNPLPRMPCTCHHATSIPMEKSSNSPFSLMTPSEATNRLSISSSKMLNYSKESACSCGLKPIRFEIGTNQPLHGLPTPHPWSEFVFSTRSVDCFDGNRLWKMCYEHGMTYE